MDINGVHLIATLNGESPDGFAYTATREQMTVGPILGTTQAIAYARSWIDAANPPSLPNSDEKTDTGKIDPQKTDSSPELPAEGLSV